MEDELKSEGKCVYCDKTFLREDIVKHLKTHLTANERANPSAKISYHLSIECANMFLQVLVEGNATFKVLDNFLRDIWVDCCGHLSGFSYKKSEIKMSDKLQNELVPKMKVRYDYDFGTPTTFYFIVAGMYHLSMKEPLILLSRNEPLKLMCRLCNKKPAVTICTIHMSQTENYLFCAACAKKHEMVCEDFEDYNLPIINSPRMGICGYTGGSIDLERDDAYGM